MTAPTPPAAKKAAANKATPKDTAPKAAAAAASSRGPGRPSTKNKRADRLGENLGAVALLLAGLGAKDDAEAIVHHAEGIAESWAALAEQNRFVARILDGANVGGAWAMALTTTGPLVAELLANHGQLGALSGLMSTRGRKAREAVADAGGLDAGGLDLGALGGLFATAAANGAPPA